jgi:hypothetical protein
VASAPLPPDAEPAAAITASPPPARTPATVAVPSPLSRPSPASPVTTPHATEALGDEIAVLAAHLDAATHRLLTCIRTFDEACGWAEQGALSCAAWLSWRIGLDPGAARERVRVARALARLPLIDDALRRGVLSYAKVRALTRVARPDNEAVLLGAAQAATGAQLERICRGLRTIDQADQPPPPDVRGVRRRDLPGGMVKLEIVLHADEAAVVLHAIEQARGDRRQASRRQEGHDDDRAPTRADGVVALAEAFLVPLAAQAHEGSRSGVTTTRAVGYELRVHLDQDLLGDDGALAATLDDGSRVSAETLRRVACDSGLVPLRMAGAAVAPSPASSLDLGRRTRIISPALRRALWTRDRGCRFPGCSHTRFLHGHHVRHWLHGGPTNLANLVMLCSAHHQLVHEGGYTVAVEADDEVVFRDTRQRLLPAVPPPAQVEDAVQALHDAAAARGIEIGPDTNLPWWDGVVPDMTWAIESLYAPDPERRNAPIAESGGRERAGTNSAFV